ncbi:MAG TPA: hypothetical protein VFC96_00395 [Anaerovoracaceae bacterium]|nr:hypothetical protein [Anaerovoracaceae bacterium]
MVNHLDYNKYYEKRTACLKQMLRISEEMLGSKDKWESYDEHLSKKEILIGKLKSLDAVHRDDAATYFTDEMKNEMDNLLNLIIALDKDIMSAVEKDRSDTLKSLKTVTKGKKITRYSNPSEEGGKFLDRKE